MSNYTIQSTALNKNRVFILQKSELEKRLDPQFYINRVKIKNSVKLSTLVKVKGGKRIPKGKYYSETPTEYQYLRVSDMQDFGLINWDGLKFIPEDVYYFLERYKVEKGDVIISIAGTVGKTAVIEKEIKNTILTENCAILEIRDKSKLLPKYLHILLELSTSKRQIELGFIQTTIPKLGFDKIEQLQLPSIPSIEKHFEIIEYYDKSIAQKQQNEAQAEKLLASIDDYLLNELGINLPEPPENTLENRMFTTSLQEITGDRFDPFYHQTYFQNIFTSIKKCKYPTSQIGKNILRYEKGIEVGSNEYTSDGVPFVRVADINDFSINYENSDKKISQEKFEQLKNKFKPITGEILYSKDGTIGFCVVVEEEKDYIISSGILRITCNSNLNNYFLKYLLSTKLYKQIADRVSIGTVIKHLTIEEWIKILIPIPPLSKQQEIADHITGIRQQAQQLKDKTSELLKQASEEIEKILLN